MTKENQIRRAMETAVRSDVKSVEEVIDMTAFYVYHWYNWSASKEQVEKVLFDFLKDSFRIYRICTKDQWGDQE